MLINAAQGSVREAAGGDEHGGGERPAPSLCGDTWDLDLLGSGAKLKQLASH